MLGIMDIHRISRLRFLNTVSWAIVLCAVIVSVAAGLARATLNMKAALIEKPDIAIYLLLPDEEIRSVDVLRETETQRDYLAQTKDGPKLVILRKGAEKWYVESMESLHEDL